jgi:protein SCO1/2
MRLTSGRIRQSRSDAAASVSLFLLFFIALGNATGAGEISSTPADADAHARHHVTLTHATRSVVQYAIPDLKLVREDGKPSSLGEAVGQGEPVVIDFIYTTCTTICPLASQTFSQLQQMMGDDAKRVRFVSISIDPEQDTPRRLADYAQKFGAGPQWHMYTGTVQASLAVQRAFDVYRGDKMSHTPVTLVRTTPDKPWVRFDGFATADELLGELRPQVAVK